MSSFFHSTVSPLFTSRLGGSNFMFRIITCTSAAAEASPTLLWAALAEAELVCTVGGFDGAGGGSRSRLVAVKSASGRAQKNPAKKKTTRTTTSIQSEN